MFVFSVKKSAKITFFRIAPINGAVFEVILRLLGTIPRDIRFSFSYLVSAITKPSQSTHENWLNWLAMIKRFDKPNPLELPIHYSILCMCESESLFLWFMQFLFSESQKTLKINCLIENYKKCQSQEKTGWDVKSVSCASKTQKRWEHPIHHTKWKTLSDISYLY